MKIQSLLANVRVVKDREVFDALVVDEINGDFGRVKSITATASSMFLELVPSFDVTHESGCIVQYFNPHRVVFYNQPAITKENEDEN